MINIFYVEDKIESFYKFLDHTADIGIIVQAEDLEDLFKKAGFSLIHLILGMIPEGERESINLNITGEDLVDLMVNWLSEILYIFEGERKILTGIEIKFLSFKNISALLKLIPFDEKRFDIQCEIKAVTYHQLEILKKNKHWQASIIFDV